MAKKQTPAPAEAIRKMNRTVDKRTRKNNPVHSSRPTQSLRAIMAKIEPKGMADLVEEMLTDYQVELAFRSIKAIIKTAQVSITVEDADHLDPAAKARAEWLAGKMLELFRRRWSIMLDCIPFGRVAFEKVWARDAQQGYYLSDLDPLPYRNTEMLLTTNASESGAGRYAGVRLTVDGQEPLDLAGGKSWWLALDPDAINPYGKSRFMGPVHKVWQHRKCQFEREDMFEDKILFNGSISHIPDDPIIEGDQSFDPHAAMDEAFCNLRGGGAMYLSNERDNDGNYLYDVNLPVGTNDAGPIINLIAMSDVQMLRAFGLLEKCIIEGAEVGSYSMVSVQMLVVRAMIDEIFDQIKNSFQEYVLDKVSEVNSMGTAKLRINSPNLAQIPDSLLIEVIMGILASPAMSPLVMSGAVDLLSILESSGVPVSDSARSEIDAMLLKLRNAPPPSAPPGGTFANFQTPGEGDDPLAGLPTLDQLIDGANAEAASLWDDLLEILARMHQTGGHVGEMQANLILSQLQELQADTMTAARLIGMVSPWKPSLSSPPNGARGIQQTLPEQPFMIVDGKPVVMSLAGINSDFSGGASVIRYPFLTDAVAWLRDKDLATAADVSQMAALDKTSVFTAAGVNSLPTLASLRKEVADSLQRGESFQNFRSRLKDSFDLPRSQQETLFRTNTKQAYVAGMEQTLDDPDVSDAFGYVLFAATTDNRTRSTHWELDGFICSRHDPAYAVLQRAVNDWNCRCSLIPLSKREAERRGIKTYRDLPSDVLARYG